MWVRSGGPPGSKAILFDYDPSRSSDVPKRLLADYHGSMMVDGYAGYDAVCTEQGIIRLGCWAHARRKFVEASKAGGKNKKSPKSEYALKLIAKLYAIEKQIKDEPADLRYARRQQNSKEVMSKLRKWLDETRRQVAPKLALGKALYYLDHRWARLVAYLDDGRYPIDNNAVENAIRPFAIGRKNWLFSSSVQGARASANLYSLIETAKANNLEPYAYLKQVFSEIPNVTNYDEVDELLPGNVKPVVAKALTIRVLVTQIIIDIMPRIRNLTYGPIKPAQSVSEKPFPEQTLINDTSLFVEEYGEATPYRRFGIFTPLIGYCNSH
jgi:transposase